MTTVAESAQTVQFDTAWQDAVERVSAIAHAKLPDSLHGRLERATALVLNGAVFMEEDGHICQVHSSQGSRWYAVNGHCVCKDAPTAPDGYCKHRLAKAIYRRAGELLHERLTVDLDPEVLSTPAPATPLPEAPASVNVHLELAGRQVQLTLRDSDEGRLLQRLDAILQRFPVAAKPTDDTSHCSKHGVPMTLNHKDGRSWWSHKTADGWCKGK